MPLEATLAKSARKGRKKILSTDAKSTAPCKVLLSAAARTFFYLPPSQIQQKARDLFWSSLGISVLAVLWQGNSIQHPESTKLAPPIVCTVQLSNSYISKVVWLATKRHDTSSRPMPIGKSSNRGRKRYTGLAHCLGKSSPESRRSSCLNKRHSAQCLLFKETLTTHLA